MEFVKENIMVIMLIGLIFGTIFSWGTFIILFRDNNKDENEEKIHFEDFENYIRENTVVSKIHLPMFSTSNKYKDKTYNVQALIEIGNVAFPVTLYFNNNKIIYKNSSKENIERVIDLYDKLLKLQTETREIMPFNASVVMIPSNASGVIGGFRGFYVFGGKKAYTLYIKDYAFYSIFVGQTNISDNLETFATTNKQMPTPVVPPVSVLGDLENYKETVRSLITTLENEE